MLHNFTPKSAKIFNCDLCDFTCCKSSDWTRHLLTRKHQNVDNVDKNVDKKTRITPHVFQCECGRTYSYRQSLSQHRKKCPFLGNGKNYDCQNTINSNLFMMIA